jgi:DNA-binding CsgD family transcriptional regulator
MAGGHGQQRDGRKPDRPATGLIVKQFTDQTVHDLIGTAYDAALRPELWPAHVERWRSVLNAAQARFVLYDLLNRSGSVEVSAGVDPSFNRLYHERFARLNPWVRAGHDAIKPGRVLHGEMLLSNAELVRTEFYNDFLRPQDVLYCSAAVLFSSGTVVGALITGRSDKAGRFTDDELDLQQRLLPHLQRAAELHRRLAEAETAKAGLLGQIEVMPTGAMIVDETARLVAMNRTAAEVFDGGDGVALGAAGRIKLSCPTAGPALEKLVGDAAREGAKQEHTAGGDLLAGRPSGKPAYNLRVIPIASSAGGRRAGPTRTLIQIEDPESRSNAALDGLKKAFGLTRSEAALALRLAQGRSVAESAAELNVSLNTVRTHLKRIYSKTDTRRQGELVSLLLTPSRSRESIDTRVRN